VAVTAQSGAYGGRSHTQGFRRDRYARKRSHDSGVACRPLRAVSAPEQGTGRALFVKWVLRRYLWRHQLAEWSTTSALHSVDCCAWRHGQSHRSGRIRDGHCEMLTDSRYAESSEAGSSEHHDSGRRQWSQISPRVYRSAVRRLHAQPMQCDTHHKLGPPKRSRHLLAYGGESGTRGSWLPVSDKEALSLHRRLGAASKRTPGTAAATDQHRANICAPMVSSEQGHTAPCTHETPSSLDKQEDSWTLNAGNADARHGSLGARIDV